MGEELGHNASGGTAVFEFVEVSRGRVAANLLPSARRVDLSGRGRTTAYEMAGPPGAPTVLLLHGLGATGLLNWWPAFGPLAEHYRVVAMDLRGHGRGIPSGPRYRLADCADDAAALADALDVDTFIAVGYSLGGPISQLLWHRHRSRVDGLVLCATTNNFNGNAMERLYFKAMWGPVAAIRASRLVPSPLRPRPPRHTTVFEPEGPPRDLTITNMTRFAFREMRRSRPASVIGAMHALGRFRSDEWIGDVDVPAAVVVTTGDQLVAPSRQYRLADSIPGATVHEADTDHFGCVLGRRAFVPALLDACASVTARAGVRAG